MSRVSMPTFTVYLSFHLICLVDEVESKYFNSTFSYTLRPTKCLEVMLYPNSLNIKICIDVNLCNNYVVVLSYFKSLFEKIYWVYIVIGSWLMKLFGECRWWIIFWSNIFHHNILWIHHISNEVKITINVFYPPMIHLNSG